MRVLAIAIALLCCAGLSAEDVTINASIKGRVTWQNGLRANRRLALHELQCVLSADDRWGCKSDVGWQAFQELHPALPQMALSVQNLSISEDCSYSATVRVSLTGGTAPKAADGRVFAAVRLTARYNDAKQGWVDLLLQDGDDLKADVRLRNFVPLELHLQSAGKSQPGVHCSLRRKYFDAERNDVPALDFVTDKNGDFYTILDGLEGAFELTLTEPGWLWDNGRDSLPLTLTPGQTAMAAASAHRAGAMHGRIVDVNGKPVQATVFAKGHGDFWRLVHEANTGVDGKFEFSGLFPTTFELTIRAAGFREGAYVKAAVTPDGDLDVGDILLEDRGYFILTVRNADGTARTDVDLYISPQPANIAPGFAVIDPENGTYLLRLSPGKYTISADPDDTPAASVDVDFEQLPAHATLQLPHVPRIRFDIMAGEIRHPCRQVWLLPFGSEAHRLLLKDGLAPTAERLTLDASGLGAIAWTNRLERPGRPDILINLGHYAVIAPGAERRWLVLDDIEIVDSTEMQTFQMQDPGLVLDLKLTANNKPAANQQFRLVGRGRLPDTVFTTDEQGKAHLENLVTRYGGALMLLRESELEWKQAAIDNADLDWFLAGRRIEIPETDDFSEGLSLDDLPDVPIVLRLESTLQAIDGWLEIQPLWSEDAKPWQRIFRLKLTPEDAPFSIVTGALPIGRYRANLTIRRIGQDNAEFTIEFEVKLGDSPDIDWQLPLRKLRVTADAGETSVLSVSYFGPLESQQPFEPVDIRRIGLRDGHEELSQLSPGHYVVCASRATDRRIRNVTGIFFETVDLTDGDGDVTLNFPDDSGTLLVSLEYATGNLRPDVHLFDPDGVQVPLEALGLGRWDTSCIRIPGLKPGRYRLVCGGRDWTKVTREQVEIRKDETTLQVVKLEPAPRLEVRFAPPDDEFRWSVENKIEIMDAGGNVLEVADWNAIRLDVDDNFENWTVSCGLDDTDTRKVRLLVAGYEPVEFDLEYQEGKTLYERTIELTKK